MMNFVEAFKAGDEIPEWIMTISPHAPNAVRGTLTAFIDLEIYERNNEYWILPASIDKFLETGKSLFQLSHSSHCTLSAGNKRLILPSHASVLNVDGTGRRQKLA